MRTRLILLVLVAAVAVFRIPSFFEPHWYDDEEMYLAIGKALHQGFHLYQSITDNKPPLLYWWVALNPTLIWLKASSALFVILSVITLYNLIQRLKLTFISLGFFILFTNLPSFEGTIFNAELMFMPLVILGMCTTWQWIINSHFTSWQKAFVIGNIFGLASLVKIPATTDFFTVLLAISTLTHHSWKNKILSTVTIIGGFLVPWLIVTGYFSLNQTFNQFVYNSILYNLKYIGDWSQISQSPIFTILSPISVRIGLTSAGIATGYILYRQKVISKAVAFVWIWLFCSWFGAIISLRPYPHYLLQLTAPFSLILGVFLTSPKLSTRLITGFIGILLSLFVYTVPFTPYRTVSYYRNWWNYITHRISAEEYTTWFNYKAVIASTLSRSINSQAESDDTLFIWGNIAAIYAQATTLPATPYVTDYLIHSYQAYSTVVQRMHIAPPQWIVHCSSTLEFPALDSFIKNSYIKTVSSTYCDLYRHKPL